MRKKTREAEKMKMEQKNEEGKSRKMSKKTKRPLKTKNTHRPPHRPQKSSNQQKQRTKRNAKKNQRRAEKRKTKQEQNQDDKHAKQINILRGGGSCLWVGFWFPLLCFLGSSFWFCSFFCSAFCFSSYSSSWCFPLLRLWSGNLWHTKRATGGHGLQAYNPKSRSFCGMANGFSVNSWQTF